MLVSCNEIIEKKGIQFNINNLEWTRFILEKCDELNFDVILGASEGAIEYMGGYKTVADIVKNLIEELNIEIKVALHLDHGKTYESAFRAINAGFSSVMIDGSKLDFYENVELTKQVVRYAHPLGVSVEGELGEINGGIVNPEDVQKFVTLTGVDLIAVAVGTEHGVYQGEAKISFETIKKIKCLTGTPLVMHGGSGLSKEIIQRSLVLGIDKININTELQQAWAKGVREFLLESPDEYDPRKIIMAGEKNFKDEVERKINYVRELYEDKN